MSELRALSSDPADKGRSQSSGTSETQNLSEDLLVPQEIEDELPKKTRFLTLFACWLGWGFDVFDAVLFNFAAPTCVPTLLGLEIGTTEAREATAKWVSWLAASLLVGWTVGGFVFGLLADRIGRARTLLITMLLFGLGTVFCALSNSMLALLLFRILVSLGIGGEWAAGVSMVAEVMPDRGRVWAAALLSTGAPIGILGATFLSRAYAPLFTEYPATAWRYFFLFGLLPALAAIFVRCFVRESPRWLRQRDAAAARPPLPRSLSGLLQLLKHSAKLFATSTKQLFAPGLRRSTIAAFLFACLSVIFFWISNSLVNSYVLAVVASYNASDSDVPNAEAWKLRANLLNQAGAVVAEMVCVPLAQYLGRRAMFAFFLVVTALAVGLTFGLDLDYVTTLYLGVIIGFGVAGPFAGLSFYLPELFPTKLRGLGSGLCYNGGRLLAAAGPLLIGFLPLASVDDIQRVFLITAALPIAQLLLLPLLPETKGLGLRD